MKKVIFFGVLIGLLASVIIIRSFSGDSEEYRMDQLVEENQKLKKDLENAREQLTPLEVENKTLNKYLDEDIQAQYIEVTFPQDGNFYRADEDFKFYEDPECSIEYDGKPVIISPEVKEETPDGEEAYCVVLTTDGLLFSRSWPELYVDNNYSQYGFNQKEEFVMNSFFFLDNENKDVH